MTGLEMKYFVLNPKSKVSGDPYAAASREAMITFAVMIKNENPQLTDGLIQWAQRESVNDPKE